MKLEKWDMLISAIQNPGKAIQFSLRKTSQLFLDRKATHIFERDWDVLIVLDACRADILAEAAAEYNFLSPFDTVYSVASQSEEWMMATFTDEYADEMAKTAVITGNPFSKTALDANDLAYLDEVWRYAWDDETGTIPARPLTDQAIKYARENRPERLVVHYMQPHFPTVPKPRLSTGPAINEFGTKKVSIWERLRSGDLSIEEVRNANIRNLHYVLNEVSVLLNNIDAGQTVITADHGEGYGEASVYGHPRGTVADVVREVPWVETTATDNHTHEPNNYETMTGTHDRNEMLHALGYK